MVEGAGRTSAPSAAALCTCNPALSRSAELASASFVRLKGCSTEFGVQDLQGLGGSSRKRGRPWGSQRHIGASWWDGQAFLNQNSFREGVRRLYRI